MKSYLSDRDMSEEQKRKVFNDIMECVNKIQNKDLRKLCHDLLLKHYSALMEHGAGHDAIEGVKADAPTHQCFDGGLLDHKLKVTLHARNIAEVYCGVDIDLVTAGAVLHDIGKIHIFDPFNKSGEVRHNLNKRYALVDHVYLGMKMVDEAADEQGISEDLKLQLLHIIGTHMDTMPKHMVEAYIVSYADSIDADVENILSYPNDAVNPLTGKHMYSSVNK